MGSMSIWHWLIVLAVVLVLFGGGSKISSLMGDFGKGLKSFKKNIADEDATHPGASAPQAPQPVADALFHAPGQTQTPPPGPYHGHAYADQAAPAPVYPAASAIDPADPRREPVRPG